MNINEYKDLCQKGDSENYILDKYIYRKISIFCTILFIKLNITPNATTFASLLAILGSLWFFTQNEPVYLVIGSLLAFTYHYLDHVDGELARYYINKGEIRPSLRGQYFDVLCHSYSINLMFLCTGFALYNKFDYDYALLLGFIAMLGSSSFPNLVAAKVMMIKVANNRGIVNDPKTDSLFSKLERKKLQESRTNSLGLTKGKLVKLLSELNGYPGIISLLIIASLLDAVFGSFTVYGYAMDFRLLLLIPAAITRLFLMPYRAYKWMKIFEKI